jgi:hypothetical protein
MALVESVRDGLLVWLERKYERESPKGRGTLDAAVVEDGCTCDLHRLCLLLAIRLRLIVSALLGELGRCKGQAEARSWVVDRSGVVCDLYDGDNQVIIDIILRASDLPPARRHARGSFPQSNKPTKVQPCKPIDVL